MVDVSVIIPTFNYGHFLPRAIDSALAQQGVDTEIIVVDDGSTDHTERVLASYDEKIRVFRQKNKGAPAARNLGLREARGEFVLFLDADDWLLPDALSSRVTLLRRNPDLGWAYSTFTCYDEQGREQKPKKGRPVFACQRQRQGRIGRYLLLGELIPICCVVVRRELALSVGGFDTDLAVLQDYEFWLRIADRAPAGFIDQCHVAILAHGGSLSRSSKDNYATLLNILLDAQTRYQETTEALGHSWRKRLAAVMLERAAHLLVDGKPRKARELLFQAIKKNPLQWKNYLYLLRCQIRIYTLNGHRQ